MLEKYTTTNLTHRLSGSLRILSLRSAHASRPASGCFLRPHGMHQQHIRRAGDMASLPAAAAAAAAAVAAAVVAAVRCSSCTLFVRRQHRNLLRHSAHFPGSLLDIAADVSSTVVATAGASPSLSCSGFERRQQPQKREANDLFSDD